MKIMRADVGSLKSHHNFQGENGWAFLFVCLPSRIKGRKTTMLHSLAFLRARAPFLLRCVCSGYSKKGIYFRESVFRSEFVESHKRIFLSARAVNFDPFVAEKKR